FRLALGPDFLHGEHALAQEPPAALPLGVVMSHLLFVPAATDAKEHAAARQPVERRNLLRERDRIALDDEADAGAELEALRRGTRRPPRHVIVCGAGVVGASVAYFLARRGVAVTVVERTGVACAASGKSGGFLALDWCDGSPLGPLARASFTLHAELAAELSTDYGYRRMETFMLAARERGTPAGGHRVAAPPWLDGSGIVTAAPGSQEAPAQVTPARVPPG